MSITKPPQDDHKSLKRKAEQLEKETSIRESHAMLTGRSDKDWSFEICEDNADPRAQYTSAPHTSTVHAFTNYEDPTETTVVPHIFPDQKKAGSEKSIRKPMGLLCESYFRVEIVENCKDHGEYAIPGRVSFYDWVESSKARVLKVPHPQHPRVNLALLERVAEVYGKEVDVDS